MKTLPSDTLIREEREHLTNIEPINDKLDIIVKVSEARFPSHSIVLEDLVGYLAPTTSGSNFGFDVHRTLEAKDFIYQHNLVNSYDSALKYIQDLIPAVKTIEVLLRSTVDTDETWIELLVLSSSTPQAIIDAEDEFLDAWLEKVPREKSDLIKFDYELID